MEYALINNPPHPPPPKPLVFALGVLTGGSKGEASLFLQSHPVENTCQSVTWGAWELG